ncbi:MAG: tRNA (N6-threonylcarbamoyladenosine(37)-N6)-methyltransferase TrmO [Saprospiraceae bacterium]|jgi:tRNA-Thr(GGU) m(6)t(6)A37 methyltransferase TsaA|nr:tRNA (N6-threonylcarbamoyladenosine(37)-N6)-methyltransferase TrmO [Saprospiraceae bacterium]MBP9210409.1 tRNA (N6-threonylcarbamoyladenosine(37)-N6)-methyltransferase TrmO [Saprospiraceae bacterium]
MSRMEIQFTPVAVVRNSRKEAFDDDWESVESEIELAGHLPAESLDGISGFSHLEIVYFFDRIKNEDVVMSGRPRDNPKYPLVGIFAQRKKDRPNKIGLATVELLEHRGRTLVVRMLDAIDGTPVLDIKPVFKEYEPRKAILQPEWVGDLMKNYW